MKKFAYDFWMTSRSEHTLANAAYPPEEDILGDTLQDEQIIHIFWCTMLGELAMTEMLWSTESQGFQPIQIFTTGLITALALSGVVKCQKEIFKFCNKKRRRQSTYDKMRRRWDRYKRERKKRKMNREYGKEPQRSMKEFGRDLLMEGVKFLKGPKSYMKARAQRLRYLERQSYREALEATFAPRKVARMRREAERRNAEAQKIQNLVRRRAARKELLKRRKEQGYDTAAERVQSAMRRKKARTKVAEMRAERKEHNKAASKIQAIKRGQQVRQEQAALKRDRLEKDAAASKIQAVRRGKEGRRKAEIKATKAANKAAAQSAADRESKRRASLGGLTSFSAAEPKGKSIQDIKRKAAPSAAIAEAFSPRGARSGTALGSPRGARLGAASGSPRGARGAAAPRANRCGNVSPPASPPEEEANTAAPSTCAIQGRVGFLPGMGMEGLMPSTPMAKKDPADSSQKPPAQGEAPPKVIERRVSFHMPSGATMPTTIDKSAAGDVPKLSPKGRLSPRLSPKGKLSPKLSPKARLSPKGKSSEDTSSAPAKAMSIGSSFLKQNTFLAKFASKIQDGDDEDTKQGLGSTLKDDGPTKGKKLWGKAKGVRMMTKAKLSAEDAERIRRSKLVPFSRKYILCRWTIGWIINLTIFAILWLGNFIYGVLHGPQSFREVLVAWAAALFQTWIIVEPSNVLALVLLPSVAEHPWVAKCYACAGEYGFI